MEDDELLLLPLLDEHLRLSPIRGESVGTGLDRASSLLVGLGLNPLNIWPSWETQMQRKQVEGEGGGRGEEED